ANPFGASYEATVGGKGLAKGPHDDVWFIAERQGLQQAEPFSPHATEIVCDVYDENGVVFADEANYPTQIWAVRVHRIEAFDDDKEAPLRVLGPRFGQNTAQVLQVIMAEAA